MDEYVAPKFHIDRVTASRLAAIVECSTDAIISKDLNSTITSWNAAAERMFGYTEEEAIGSSILMLIPPEIRDDENNIIAQIKSGARIQSFETVRVRKDGTTIHVSLTISPIMDKSGKIVGASKIARDISATKDNERRIRVLMQELNHRVKNQFAVILSMVRATARSAQDVESFKEQIEERVAALARSHDLLVQSEWNGAGLFNLIEEHLKPFSIEGKIALSGPLINLSMSAVQHLGMAFHELATNSVKHGALSQADGKIAIDWAIAAHPDGDKAITIVWDETFVPVPVTGERRVGFGTVVLKTVAPRALSGEAEIEHLPTGMRYTLTAPLKTVSAQGAD